MRDSWSLGCRVGAVALLLFLGFGPARAAPGASADSEASELLRDADKAWKGGAGDSERAVALTTRALGYGETSASAGARRLLISAYLEMGKLDEAGRATTEYLGMEGISDNDRNWGERATWRTSFAQHEAAGDVDAARLDLDRISRVVQVDSREETWRELAEKRLALRRAELMRDANAVAVAEHAWSDAEKVRPGEAAWLDAAKLRMAARDAELVCGTTEANASLDELEQLHWVREADLAWAAIVHARVAVRAAVVAGDPQALDQALRAYRDTPPGTRDDVHWDAPYAAALDVLTSDAQSATYNRAVAQYRRAWAGSDEPACAALPGLADGGGWSVWTVDVAALASWYRMHDEYTSAGTQAFQYDSILVGPRLASAIDTHTFRAELDGELLLRTELPGLPVGDVRAMAGVHVGPAAFLVGAGIANHDVTSTFLPPAEEGHWCGEVDGDERCLRYMGYGTLGARIAPQSGIGVAYLGVGGAPAWGHHRAAPPQVRVNFSAETLAAKKRVAVGIDVRFREFDQPAFDQSETMAGVHVGWVATR